MPCKEKLREPKSVAHCLLHAVTAIAAGACAGHLTNDRMSPEHRSQHVLSLRVFDTSSKPLVALIQLAMLTAMWSKMNFATNSATVTCRRNIMWRELEGLILLSDTGTESYGLRSCNH